MSRLKIPEKLRGGFNEIASLSLEEIGIISESINSLSPDSGVLTIADKLNQIKISGNVELIAEVIYSFGSLLFEAEYSNDQISESLTESFFNSPNSNDPKFQALQKKIEKLLDSSKGLTIGLKALYLQTDNNLNYKSSRIFTDLRTVFEGAFESLSAEVNYGVIIHQLKISTFKGENEKSDDIFISMDTGDLLDLRRQIDRALEKQNLLAKNLDDKIKLIDFKD